MQFEKILYQQTIEKPINQLDHSQNYLNYILLLTGSLLPSALHGKKNFKASKSEVSGSFLKIAYTSVPQYFLIAQFWFTDIISKKSPHRPLEDITLTDDNYNKTKLVNVSICCI